jgi:hypothetical protein
MFGVNRLSHFPTVINIAAAAGACFAAYYTAQSAKATQEAVRIANDARNDNLKPILDFRRTEHSPPDGQVRHQS